MSRLPQQSSALTRIRGAVTGHQVAGTSFGKVAGSPSASAAHHSAIQRFAQNLDEHAKHIDALTQGVRGSDAEVAAFDERQAEQQKAQGGAVPDVPTSTPGASEYTGIQQYTYAEMVHNSGKVQTIRALNDQANEPSPFADPPAVAGAKAAATACGRGRSSQAVCGTTSRTSWP